MSEFVMVKRELMEDMIDAFDHECRKEWADELRAVLAQEAGMVERKPDAIIEGVMTSVGITHAIYASTVSLKDKEQVMLYTSPPAPVSVVHPFAEKVISKLRRFEECASDSDSGGVDIGRHWLDLLTQLGLLNRVQRSPAFWEMTQQGEDCLGKVKELNQ